MRCRLATIAVAVLMSCMACQEGRNVSLVNQCRTEIQADAVSQADTFHIDPQWTSVPAGSEKVVRQIVATAPRAHIRVRGHRGGPVKTFDVATESSSNAPVTVLVQGDRCP